MNLFSLWRDALNPKTLDNATVTETESNTTENDNVNTTETARSVYIMANPLMNLTETDLRDLCRHHIDTFENWSRRIIDETFKDKYGSDYFNYTLPSNQPLIKNELLRRIEKRVQENPGRYPRMIDAILLEDIEYFLCRDDFYDSYFKAVLEPFFSGQLEVRSVLNRLIPIRNKLSHSNTISLHEAEQCICYTGDFISVYKQHYINMGKERVYNVPVILRIKDSLGTDLVRNDSNSGWEIYFVGVTNPEIHFRSGDSYKLWLEVDSSFDQSFYTISWIVKQDYRTIIKEGTGSVIEFSLDNKNVSYAPEIHIALTTKRDWHRFHDIDDLVEVHYSSVLPPIEDTF